MRITDSRITSTVALVFASVWLGGLLALGAIAAPIVFMAIPRPEAVEAMTAIFQRFDMVAVACVIVILATEAWRAPGTVKVSRRDLARMLTGVLGAVLVLAEALWITPAIVALHRGGAIRGLGAAGLELDRMHSLAETCGKAQVAAVIALIALEVATIGSPTAGADRPKSLSKIAADEARDEAPHGA